MKKNLLLLAALFIFTSTSLVYGDSEMSSAKKENLSVATISTTSGDITILLLNETPIHKANFIRLAESDYYSGMSYHRVIEGFIIQIGDPRTKEANYPRVEHGADGVEPLLTPEIVRNAIHTMGAVSAARNNDDINPERKSSGSHYSIMTGNSTTTEETLEKVSAKSGYKYSKSERERYLKNGGAPRLDGLYVVFGYVIEGMNTVGIIEMAKGNEKNNPFDTYIIKKIKIKEMSRKKFDKKYTYPAWL